MNQKAANLFLLTAFGLLLLWGIQQFLLPALPPAVNSGALTLAIAASTAVGFLAKLKDVVEVFKWLFSRAEAKTPVDPLQKKRNRQIMLQKMERLWIEGVLKRTIYREAWIDLPLRLEAGRGGSLSWEMPFASRPANQPLTLSPAAVAGFIEQTGASLVLTGAPGSGKTSALLRVAEELLRQAAADESRPLPVVIDLSSWAGQRRPLREWLPDEMRKQYQIPPEATRAWLSSSELLFLFDGLDEMHPRDHSDCVKALNQFWQQSGAGQGLLCCRPEVYAALDEKPRLEHKAAILPLGPEAVSAHLRRFGLGLPAAAEDPAVFAEMAAALNTPLLLTIYLHNRLKEKEEGGAPQGAGGFFPLKTFIEIALKDAGVYARQDTLRWLRSIAGKMLAQGQSLLQIERLQPDWLPARLQQVYLFLTRLVPAAAAGLALGHFLDQRTWVYSGLCFGLLFSLLSMGLVWQRETAAGRQKPGWLANHRQLGLWLAIAQSGLLFAADYLWRYPLYLADRWYTPAGALTRLAVNDLLSGLVFGLVAWAMSRSANPQPGLREDIRPLEDWKVSPQSAAASIAGGMGGGVAFGLLFSLLLFIILAVLEGAGWQTLLAAGEWGLSIGFFAGPLVGVTHILHTNTAIAEMPAKIKPNAGVWLSLRNGLLFGLALGLLSGLILSLFSWLLKGQGLGASRALYTYYDHYRGAALGLVSFCYAAFVFGGAAFLRHFVLRGLLGLTGALPLDLPGFLDHATNRALMIRSGNRYLFRHRAVLDHFGESDEP